MKQLAVVLTLGLLLTIGVTSISAQTGGGYDLTWSTIDGGGGNATGGNYTLDGTIGQADAGGLSGGRYTLNGGFWIASANGPMNRFVYLPLVLKGQAGY
jgi:hypothetical protein